jgi:hypothetical protein
MSDFVEEKMVVATVFFLIFFKTHHSIHRSINHLATSQSQFFHPITQSMFQLNVPTPSPIIFRSILGQLTTKLTSYSRSNLSANLSANISGNFYLKNLRTPQAVRTRTPLGRTTTRCGGPSAGASRTARRLGTRGTTGTLCSGAAGAVAVDGWQFIFVPADRADQRGSNGVNFMERMWMWRWLGGSKDHDVIFGATRGKKSNEKLLVFRSGMRSGSRCDGSSY